MVKITLSVRLTPDEIRDVKRLTYEPKAATAVAIAVRQFVAANKKK